MTEYSYPIVNQPLPAAQWSSVTKGIGNGILDQGGFPYRLIFQSDANATNQGIIKAPTDTSANQKYGHAIVEGFYHRYDADITLDFPAVTKTTTYMVILQYDPANTALPVQLKVVTSLSYTQGKNHLHLWNVVREPNQLLTDAAVRMVRPRVAPVMVVASTTDLPKAFKTLWGTLAIVHNGRTGNNAKLYMAMNKNAEGDDTTEDSWFWKPVYDPDLDDHTFSWQEQPDGGPYAYAGSGFQRAIGRRGKARKLRGRVSLVNPSRNFEPRSEEYTPWSTATPLDPSDRPAATQRFLTALGGTSTPGFALVEISAGGYVYAWVSKTTSFIGLDGIEWEAK